MRVRPYLGRFFGVSDERGPNSAPYVVLTYAYWHSHFSDDRSVLGRTVLLNKHPFTVIGVAPEGFQGTLLFISPEFFMPIVNQSEVDGEDLLTQRGNSGGIFEAMGRLKPGVTPEAATADLNSIGSSLAKTYPKMFSSGKSLLVREGLTSFGGPVRDFVAGFDVAGWFDSGGGVRESGKLVRGAFGRPVFAR